jgi:hypothetical protein
MHSPIAATALLEPIPRRPIHPKVAARFAARAFCGLFRFPTRTLRKPQAVVALRLEIDPRLIGDDIEGVASRSLGLGASDRRGAASVSSIRSSPSGSRGKASPSRGEGGSEEACGTNNPSAGSNRPKSSQFGGSRLSFALRIPVVLVTRRCSPCVSPNNCPPYDCSQHGA